RKKSLQLASQRAAIERGQLKASSSSSSPSSPASSSNALGALHNSLLSLKCPLELAKAFEEAKARCESIEEIPNTEMRKLDEEGDMKDEAYVK
ncbi:nbp2b, partial [Cystoisospora suis]